MKAIKKNNTIQVYAVMPKFYNNTPYYNTLSNDKHIADGWQTVEVPEIDYATQRLSEIKEDENGVFYYEVIDINADELQAIEDAEIQMINDRLNASVFNSRLHSKAIAMGKQKTDDLDYFEDVYTSKYNMCLGTDFDDILELERVAEGYEDLATYKAYVIERYEAGHSFFEQSKAMLEVFRKIVLQHIENAEIDKANEKIQALNDLPIDLSPQDFGTQFESIIAL